MRFREFVRETRFRTVGIDGWRLVGEGLIVPARCQSSEEWEREFAFLGSAEPAQHVSAIQRHTSLSDAGDEVTDSALG